MTTESFQEKSGAQETGAALFQVELSTPTIPNRASSLRDSVLRSLGLLIFTEFRDTLDYLAGDGQGGRPLGKLRKWGYDVVTIHGQMGMDARIEAEHAFRDRAQIMVAAGEGINLQFCSLMVNYDIPWNPNRLEQRMGRIHC